MSDPVLWIRLSFAAPDEYNDGNFKRLRCGTRIIRLEALQKNRDLRYQDAAELLADLRRSRPDAGQIPRASPAIRRPISRVRPPVSHSRRKRIQALAMLPLANMSDDPGQDYFADGMTEALICNLAKLGALRIISRTSAMRYKGSLKSLPEIARELNVDAVVEGSVLRVGQRVRVTAQLIQAATDMHLWAETYDRDLQDVMILRPDSRFQDLLRKMNFPQS
jgi:TolB-like protein